MRESASSLGLAKALNDYCDAQKGVAITDMNLDSINVGLDSIIEAHVEKGNYPRGYEVPRICLVRSPESHAICILVHGNMSGSILLNLMSLMRAKLCK